MKLDLSELLGGKRSAVSFDYAFDPAQVAEECAAMPDDVTIPENGIRVRGQAVDSFGALMFRAEITVTYETRCARCLDPVKKEYSFDMERMILTDSPADRALSHVSEDGEWDGVTDDVLYVNEGSVDPDAEIVEEVSLTVPTFDLVPQASVGSLSVTETWASITVPLPGSPSPADPVESPLGAFIVLIRLITSGASLE